MEIERDQTHDSRSLVRLKSIQLYASESSASSGPSRMALDQNDSSLPSMLLLLDRAPTYFCLFVVVEIPRASTDLRRTTLPGNARTQRPFVGLCTVM